MADYALPALSDDEPCGPDLDFAGDGEFLNYLSAVEGQLPTAFFSFDRKTLDFPPLMEGGDKLLHRSQDLRVLLALAKLAIRRRPSLTDQARRIGKARRHVIDRDQLVDRLRILQAQAHGALAQFQTARTGDASVIAEEPP